MPVKLGGTFGIWLFRKISRKPSTENKSDKTIKDQPLSGARKLEKYFGPEIWKHFAGKVVLDFGCGSGVEAVAVAAKGAELVYGIDVQDWRLEEAHRLANRESVANRCVFLNAYRDASVIESLRDKIGCAYSLDSFEHYSDPKLILTTLLNLLKPRGSLHISFGPPWKHPRGGHMFFLCSLPWFHLIFTEEAILTVRAEHRHDGAKRFGDVEGGLNQMTIAQFVKIVKDANFQVQELQLVPIKGQSLLTRHRVLREYFTSVVKCILIRPDR
jgi:2-polyprenyl-3-methyl-5-hydroxy-6-metoxy-1,4-benzoquinol methylase